MRLCLIEWVERGPTGVGGLTVYCEATNGVRVVVWEKPTYAHHNLSPTRGYYRTPRIVLRTNPNTYMELESVYVNALVRARA